MVNIVNELIYQLIFSVSTSHLPEVLSPACSTNKLCKQKKYDVSIVGIKKNTTFAAPITKIHLPGWRTW